jgi:Ankyrin repeats (many copies)
MFKHPGRLIGRLCIIAVIGVAVAIIVNNAVQGSAEADVLSKDPAIVRKALQKKPELAMLKLMQQGSASSSVGARTSNNLWAGRYVIHHVVADGDVAVADVLAEFGADLAVRLNGESLLHIAAQASQLDMIRWLVSKGANVNDRNNCKGCEHEGRTPLHNHRRIRDREVTELLLSLGADVNAADATGQTPLHVAGDTGSATVLCAYGANVNQRDGGGSTAFNLAQRVPAQSQPKPGQHADWIRPGGGCERLAARAKPGQTPVWDEVWAEYRRYVCDRGQSPELRDCPKKS